MSSFIFKLWKMLSSVISMVTSKSQPRMGPHPGLLAYHTLDLDLAPQGQEARKSKAKPTFCPLPPPVDSPLLATPVGHGPTWDPEAALNHLTLGQTLTSCHRADAGSASETPPCGIWKAGSGLERQDPSSHRTWKGPEPVPPSQSHTQVSAPITPNLCSSAQPLPWEPGELESSG